MNRTNFIQRRWYFRPPFILAALALFGLIFMLLWNAVIPQVFHLSQVTYLQAVGILIISRILFGSFHKPWHHYPHWGPFREKLAKMSPEERKEFIANLRRYHHDYCHIPQDKGNSEQQVKTENL